jgi:hypothetical protein
VAEQAHHLAGVQLARHIIDGAQRTEVLVDPDHLDEWRAHLGHLLWRLL